MDRTDWLLGLKAGDKVAYSGTALSQPAIYTVERVTDKYVYCTNGGRFSRRDGMYGRGFDVCSIKPLTAEFRAIIYHKRRVAKLRAIKWESLPSTLLSQILNLINETTANAAAPAKDPNDEG